MNLPNLSILGIDTDLVKAMADEHQKPDRKRPGPPPTRRLGAEENRKFVPTRLSEAVMSKVCKGYPFGPDLPLMKTSTGRVLYPLRDMQVGQHFFVPNRDGRTTKQTQNCVTSSVRAARITWGILCHQRRYADGVRVWRIA